MTTERIYGSEGELGMEIGEDFVATIEIRRPPNNYISLGLVDALAEALGALDEDDSCRTIVLCATGKHFCAGGDFSEGGAQTSPTGGEARNVYDEADRLFANRKPIVAAIQGAAIGAGLGLSLVADFRVAAPEARFAANFARLGFHHGFVLSATLPRAVGQQKALELLYTGRRVKGDEALAIGLADRLAPQAEVRNAAHELAREIAISAPLAVQSTRATLRQGLVEQIRLAVARESAEQNAQFKTADFKEGVAAMAARREPQFKGE